MVEDLVKDLRALLKKHSWLLDQPEAAKPQQPSTPGTGKNIPTEAVKIIDKLIGLNAEQIDTVMSFVACPENGSSDWAHFYNYIEFGDDSSVRGYTCTIFGATSGTGSLLKVFDELAKIDPKHTLLKYHAALKKANGGSVKGLEGLAHVGGDHTKAKANYSAFTPNGRGHLDHIEGDLAKLSNDDPAWRLAVWRAFIALNWESAANFCSKTGPCADRPGPVLTTPLAKGFIVDMSLNHGDCTWWNDADTWKVVFQKMKNPLQKDETKWLEDLIKARKAVLASGYASLDWSKTGDRCTIWSTMLKQGNVTLQRPITIPSSTATPYPIWQPNLTLS